MVKGRIARETRLARVPIIGKVRAGIKDDRGLPKSTDYFLPDGPYSDYFTKVFGKNPKSIEVMFISNDYTQSCNERFEIRQGAKLFADGDGETFRVWDEKAQDYGEYTKAVHPDIMRRIAVKLQAEWINILTLTFIIPRITGVFGAWQLTTRGEKSSIPQIISAFDTVQDMAGTIINIPFDLQIEKVTSQRPGSKSSFPVIKLIPNVSQGHLEKVRLFYDSGVRVHGLLTEDRIDKIEKETLKLDYQPADAGQAELFPQGGKQ
jgi:hypothetical protein